MIYKIIAKIIANRLKVIMPSIISDSQCAFVSRRQITDYVLIVYEIIHYLRHKKGGRKGFISLKLNMSKANDRV